MLEQIGALRASNSCLKRSALHAMPMICNAMHDA